MTSAFENLKARQSTTAPKIASSSAFDALKQRADVVESKNNAVQAPKPAQDSVRGGFAGEMLTGNTQRFGKTIGESLAAPGNADLYAETIKNFSDVRNNLATRIHEKRQRGEDTKSFEDMLKTHNDGMPNIEDFTGDVINKTTGQVAGEALGTALEVIPFGTYGKATKGMVAGELASNLKKAPTLAEGAIQAFTKPKSLLSLNTAKIAGEGAAFGFGIDVSQGLQNKEGGESFKPGLGTAIGAVAPVAISSVAKGVSNTLRSTTEKLQNNIIEKFEKGIKPLINARVTPTQATKYKANIVDAAQTIDKNKANLKFADEAGEIIEGRNPKTLQELSESVEQTKKSIFTQYDQLAADAGEAGLKIKTNPISDELNTVINNEALQISNPSAIKYAQELQQRLSFRELSPKTTQDVIQNYNESLKAFYRNPSYDNASKASIDALVVNKFRSQLDEGISGVTGSQYQALRNKYASLKTIEKDVIKAALRDARKNNKGLIDYTDILTGGDVITGILTMNPAQMLRGSAMRGIKEFYKYLNSPNRAVNAMFESAERLNKQSNTTRLPKSKELSAAKKSGKLPTKPQKLGGVNSANK